MFHRFNKKQQQPVQQEQPAPEEPTLTVVEMELLLCSAYGCNNQANPQNAVVTGVLGICKAWVFFCQTCEDKRKEKLAGYAGSHNKKEKEKIS